MAILLLILPILLFSSSIFVCEAKLAFVHDEELMNMIRNGNYLIVLFSTTNCNDCDTFERELESIQEEILTDLNAPIVKVVDSQMTRLYSPTKEPVVVFLRHGVPLLYNGPANSEFLQDSFINNKEPIVKELTDEIFEPLTQVATGATTGDWFVMFYSPECVDCHRLQALWEAVGAKLKTRMNVARMNKAGVGSSTADRFGVDKVPAFILFRQGKMYRYQIQKYDVASFTSFAQDWYKNMKPERVPLPQSPFDEFIAIVAGYLQQNPLIWQLGGGIFSLTLLVILIKFIRGSPEKPKPRKRKGNKEK